MTCDLFPQRRAGLRHRSQITDLLLYLRECMICVKRWNVLQTWIGHLYWWPDSKLSLSEHKHMDNSTHGKFKELLHCHSAEIKPQWDKYGCETFLSNLERLLWASELLQSVICGAASMTSLLVKRSSHLRNGGQWRVSWSSADSKNHGIEPAFFWGEILPFGNKKFAVRILQRIILEKSYEVTIFW